MVIEKDQSWGDEYVRMTRIRNWRMRARDHGKYKGSLVEAKIQRKIVEPVTMLMMMQIEKRKTLTRRTSKEKVSMMN